MANSVQTSAGQSKHRIGTLAIALFVLCALVADLIGLIPLAKDLTGTIFWGISSFILWRKGLGMFNGRKLAAMAMSWVAGLIPIIQELPIEITVGIIAVIIISRIEEKTSVSVIKPMSGGKSLSSAGQVLNSGGRREPVPEIEDTQTRNPDLKPLNIDGVRQPAQQR